MFCDARRLIFDYLGKKGTTETRDKFINSFLVPRPFDAFLRFLPLSLLVLDTQFGGDQGD